MRTVIRFVKGDITQQDVDAIVNAANSVLLGGGGVDGAIHRAAGPELLQECRHVKETELASTGGLLPTGQAVITKGYRLPARFVIHTVGPIYKSDAHPQESLYNAYSNSLVLAEKHGLQTIAFPSISTGVYGYPVAEAAEIALRAAHDFGERKDTALREIRFVLFSDHDYGVFRDAAMKMGLEE